MSNLFTAIALEVAFQKNVGGCADFLAQPNVVAGPVVARTLFVAHAQTDLAERSGIANPMEVPVDKIVEVLTNMAEDAIRAATAHAEYTYVVWCEKTGYSPTTYFRTSYDRPHDAKRQAAKLRTKGYPDAVWTTLAYKLRAKRYHLVKNMLNQSGGWVVEAVGTPNYLSVASEAYHSA